jgi:hypothetical protein
MKGLAFDRLLLIEVVSLELNLSNIFSFHLMEILHNKSPRDVRKGILQQFCLMAESSTNIDQHHRIFSFLETLYHPRLHGIQVRPLLMSHGKCTHVKPKCLQVRTTKKNFKWCCPGSVLGHCKSRIFESVRILILQPSQIFRQLEPCWSKKIEACFESCFISSHRECSADSRRTVRILSYLFHCSPRCETTQDSSYLLLNTAGCASVTLERTDQNGICTCRLSYVCRRPRRCFVNQELEDTELNCDLNSRGLQKLKTRTQTKVF